MDSLSASVVKRTKVPESYGIAILVVNFLMKYVPFVAKYLTWQSGFMSLRKLPPNLLRLGITTEALPPRSYKHRNYNEESLDLDAFMSLQVDSQGGTVSSLDLHQSFVSGQTTPLTVAEGLLKKLVDSKQIGPNGYLNEVHPSDVLLQAEASAKRYQSGKPRSVLDGVPVVVKNEFDVQGYRTRVGTRFINVDAVAEHDADIVKNLRDLGAIIVGVTNMVEVGYSPVDEKLRNPWNNEHSCGGSSSGSGGAVGGGFVPLAIGCDGGGSIRLPAAFCGAYGLKPTCSRLSAKGEFPSCPTVAVGGPIAATASDLCIGYLAMADRSRHLPPVHVPRDFLKFSVTGLRVGVMREYNAQVFNPAITQALNRVEAELIKQGAIIVPIEFPYLELVRIAHLITIGSELTATLEADPSGNSHMMSYSNAINSVGINCLGTMDYIHAQKLRTYAINRLCSLFDSKSNDAVDLILSPTSAVTAPKLPSNVKYGWSNVTQDADVVRFAFLANFCGVPAVSCPVGVDEKGLPVGIQFMGEWWSEGTLLGVSKWMENMFGGVGDRATKL